MEWGRKRRFMAAGAGAGVLGLLCATGLRAWSRQDDNYRLLREALVTPTTAYLALPPQFLCGNGPNTISTSPDGKDALITHRVAVSAQNLEQAFQDPQTRERDAVGSGVNNQTQVLLYSQGDDHAQIVWRGGGSLASGITIPGAIRWLPGTRAALMTVDVYQGPLPDNFLQPNPGGEPRERPVPTQTVFLINTVTGKLQAVANNLKDNTLLVVSETDPVSALVDIDAGTVQRLEASGKLGPLLRYEKPGGKNKMPFWDGFLPDGKTLSGSLYERAAEGTPAKRTYYQFDTVTGILTEVAEPGADTGGVYPRPIVDADVPFTVHREKGTLTRGGVATTVYPLWLEGRDKEVAGRTLIAADSDPASKPIVLQSAVVYQDKGSVYAVPILKSNAPEFLARRREMQKQETIKRAQRIGTALMMYSQDYDEVLPPPGSDVATIVDPYLQKPSVFQNPTTGQNGFTALYKSPNLSAYQNPATTPLGTLSGPGGTAVIYVDGHVAWKDDGSDNVR